FCGWGRAAMHGAGTGLHQWYVQPGFWLSKQPTTCGSNGLFGPGHSDGDVLLFASFTSGGMVASVSEFLWSAACTANGKAGCLSPWPTGGFTAANATGVDCAGKTVNLCGAFNGTASITTPWAPGSVGTNGFFEVGMDLTQAVTQCTLVQLLLDLLGRYQGVTV